MENKPVINIMAMDFDDPATEEEFNTWYNAHIDMLLTHKGMQKAARYKRIGDDEQVPKYIAIYSFDSLKDFEEYNVSPERTAGHAVGVKRPEGAKMRWRCQYELIKNWEK